MRAGQRKAADANCELFNPYMDHVLGTAIDNRVAGLTA
jgi:hypothetical protein